MVLRPDSVLVITGPDIGEKQADGLVCCHCGRSHIVAAALRSLVTSRPDAMGFCMKCNAPHCSTCTKCVPQEQWAGNVEAGRDPLADRAPFAAFPKNPLILPW
jgi:hypothetical protein